MIVEGNRLIKVKNEDLDEQRKFVFPKGITEIGEYAFSQCNLIEITIPSSVEKIGKSAFINSRELREVNLQEGLKEIGDCAFSQCCSLTKITIPGSVEKIGYGAFIDCRELRKVNLQEGLKEIGDRAFWWCKNLTEIAIPSSVEKLYVDTFFGCTNLIKIKLSKDTNLIEHLSFHDKILPTYLSNEELYKITNRDLKEARVEQMTSQELLRKGIELLKTSRESLDLGQESSEIIDNFIEKYAEPLTNRKYNKER